MYVYIFLISQKFTFVNLHLHISYKKFIAYMSFILGNIKYGNFYVQGVF